MTTEDRCTLALLAPLRLAPRTRLFQARLGARDAALLNFAAGRPGSEWLIVVRIGFDRIGSLPGADQSRSWFTFHTARQ